MGLRHSWAGGLDEGRPQVVSLCRLLCRPLLSFFFFFFKDFIIDFLERGTEAERDRNISVWLPLTCPYWEPGLQPRPVP